MDFRVATDDLNRWKKQASSLGLPLMEWARLTLGREAGRTLEGIDSHLRSRSKEEQYPLDTDFHLQASPSTWRVWQKAAAKKEIAFRPWVRMTLNLEIEEPSVGPPARRFGGDRPLRTGAGSTDRPSFRPRPR